ncbi:MAG: dTMP kinase [Desulfomonilaceae bacterium]
MTVYAPPPTCGKPKIRPCFIVFEGIDGSGKTTQARLLAQRLNTLGLSVLLTAEPSEGPAGRIIRSLTTRPGPEEEARLFTEDRRDHVQRVIIPALSQGRTVICDRYVYSSAAYQGARGLDPTAIISAQSSFAPSPDVTFLLEVPIDIALARIASARCGSFSAFEVRENLEAVDAVYRSLIDSSIKRIDGTASPEVIHANIIESILELECYRKSRYHPGLFGG